MRCDICLQDVDSVLWAEYSHSGLKGPLHKDGNHKSPLLKARKIPRRSVGPIGMLVGVKSSTIYATECVSRTVQSRWPRDFGLLHIDHS